MAKERPDLALFFIVQILGEYPVPIIVIKEKIVVIKFIFHDLYIFWQVFRAFRLSL